MLKNMVAILLSAICLHVHASQVYVYLYNQTDFELIYPQSPVLRTAACMMGPGTMGPDANRWHDYQRLDPFDPMPMAMEIYGVTFPSLEACEYVSDARPKLIRAKFRFYYKNTRYCVNNLPGANGVYARLVNHVQRIGNHVHVVPNQYVIVLEESNWGETCVSTGHI